MSTCLFSDCSSFDRLDDCYVEVKTVLPNEYGMKRLTTKMKVQWKRNGEASFHRTCWDKLLKATRARKQHSHLPKICEQEKCLLKEAAKTAEFFDSPKQIRHSAVKCAALIKSASHLTVFTGAGISTSAGIGDYRGKSGKWTQQDQTAVDMDAVFQTGHHSDCQPLEDKDPMQDNGETRSATEETEGCVEYESLRPTYTHQALVKLMEDGYLKYVISQNGDGLHGLSGVPSEKMSELHGNVFIEVCEKCGARFSRPYYVMDDLGSQFFEETEDSGSSSVRKPKHAKQCNSCGLSHRTGRQCGDKGCAGYLKDSIINFGDSLEEDILSAAEDNARQSDLMLCLGSTLTVTPANSLVAMTKPPGNLIICNRQKTHMDQCYGNGVRVFGNCDVFMREVMKCVFDPADLQEWEEGQQKRLLHYDSQRSLQT